jgi:hypothetical protein
MHDHSSHEPVVSCLAPHFAVHPLPARILWSPAQVDPRLVRVILAAPAFHTTEAALMPGLITRMAAQVESERREREAAEAAVAAAEADLANLLAGEDGSDDEEGNATPQQLKQQQVQEPGAGTSTAAAAEAAITASLGTAPAVANLFGPAIEEVLVMDTFGSMAGPARGSSSSGNPGAPLLQRLLTHAALALRLRPDSADVLLPDPGEEAMADTRVATWREALVPLQQAGALAAATAATAIAVGGQQEQEQQYAAQQQWLPPPPAEEGGAAEAEEWAFDDEADSMEWMQHVPMAPQRDDTGQARLAGTRGESLRRPLRFYLICQAAETRRHDTHIQHTYAAVLDVRP